MDSHGDRLPLHRVAGSPCGGSRRRHKTYIGGKEEGRAGRWLRRGADLDIVMVWVMSAQCTNAYNPSEPIRRGEARTRPVIWNYNGVRCELAARSTRQLASGLSG
jgi:hypothetical protein